MSTVLHSGIDIRDRGVLVRVGDELRHARAKHGEMHSAHESYSVIKEELDEFWDEVRKQKHDKKEMANELIQVAAMAVRAVVDLELLSSPNSSIPESEHHDA